MVALVTALDRAPNGGAALVTHWAGLCSNSSSTCEALRHLNKLTQHPPAVTIMRNCLELMVLRTFLSSLVPGSTYTLGAKNRQNSWA